MVCRYAVVLLSGSVVVLLGEFFYLVVQISFQAFSLSSLYFRSFIRVMRYDHFGSVGRFVPHMGYSFYNSLCICYIERYMVLKCNNIFIRGKKSSHESLIRYTTTALHSLFPSWILKKCFAGESIGLALKEKLTLSLQCTPILFTPLYNYLYHIYK